MHEPDKKPAVNPNIRRLITIGLVVLALVFIFNMALDFVSQANIETVPYSQFISMLDEGQVAQAQVQGDRIYFNSEPSPPQKGLLGEEQEVFVPQYMTGRIDDAGLVERMEAAGVEYASPVARQQSPLLSFLISWILPMALLYGAFTLITRSMSKRMGGESMSFGKNTAKIYGEKETGVTFQDVAGQEEAKESLVEIIDFLKHPAKYASIGARMPKGALLVGPPGTGKTLLAKAVAGEAGVPFFALSGSDFVEMFVGVGASRVRDLFKQAVEKAPCIVFIDEIDAIGKSRANNMMGGNDEREQTLNQLLAEMDGFDSSKGVVMLAATNRPEILDPALLRPGRFDRRIIVDKPDYLGRLAVLKVHARGVRMSEAVDLEKIARITPGAVGADLANMINEAALRAVGQGRSAVAQEDLVESVEIVIAGKEKKDRILSDQEKRLVAVHEAGHAMAALVCNGRMPVQKITIVPRTMGSLGYVMQAEEDEKYLYTKEDLTQRLIVLTAGRAAEELIAGKITTGAANDIEKATEIARAMVAQYGMSDAFGMVKLADQNAPYLGGRSDITCSDEVAALIDAQVQEFIREAYRSAADILDKRRETLLRVSDALVERETLTGEELMELAGPLPSMV